MAQQTNPAQPAQRPRQPPQQQQHVMVVAPGVPVAVPDSKECTTMCTLGEGVGVEREQLLELDVLDPKVVKQVCEDALIDPAYIGERFNFFEDCPEAKTCTLVLRGGAEQFIAEVERSLHVESDNDGWNGDGD
ncbi:hypothetical protein B0T24DRAFT_712046 [Lasiosphaeria ovina]|uniref:Uncharacterized protein n=1 Tax=Lasiosphaeria ovina TaxID=92902 RepID=A0AAE0N0C2_9PEZI|nr:hypothetical protein B0T24DRAFT_712046 [Lasiosphaeria ovina]